MKARINDIEKLKIEILKDVPDIFENDVKAAIEYGIQIHKNDFRNSGENFIIHTLNVARGCCELKTDTCSIIAAILHQAPSLRLKSNSEADSIMEEIKLRFGQDVYNIIIGINEINQATKINEETNFETLKKYLVGGIGDLRPMLIKLCDELDDVRTYKYISPEKKVNFSKKVFDVYAPISEYLNIFDVKQELEETMFLESNPEEYEKITQMLKNKGVNISLKRNYQDYLKIVTDILGYNPKIFGRIKGIYSIHNKIKKYRRESETKGLDDIKDLLAFTILTQDVSDCYKILQSLQTLFEYDISLLDDYIANPKPNGYSALHISLKIPEISSIYIEVQILTYEMYLKNTYGPSSHIAYKLALKREVDPTSKYSWVEQIHNAINEHINKRSTERSIPINPDIFSNEIFVYTPKKKIVQLPVNACALDFAYVIHSVIGHSAVSALINGKEASLNTKLNTGDMVEIICRRGRIYPEENWLEYDITPTTRKRIIKQLVNKLKVK